MNGNSSSQCKFSEEHIFGETDETYTKHLEVKKAARNKSFFSKFSCNVIIQCHEQKFIKAV